MSRRARTREAYSAALCRGLIEASTRSAWMAARLPRYSAALCRGLIEALSSRKPCNSLLSIPRLYAAASLKRGCTGTRRGASYRYSAALCRGLIEACAHKQNVGFFWQRYSAALCRGLIEAKRWSARNEKRMTRIPRLYAAASLKHRAEAALERAFPQYSAALCRGLIEA